MCKPLRNCLAFSFLLTVSSLGFARNPLREAVEPSLGITVNVRDYARVSHGTLARAEREAARIFHEAGVETLWRECPLTGEGLQKYPACQQYLGATGFYLSILPGFMPMGGLSPDAMGWTAMAKEGERDSIADVFYDRVKERALASSASVPQLLGHVIAHELGHLLLRTSHHSAIGIMRARWETGSLLLAAKGQLNFTPEQVDLIRAEIRARLIQGAPAAFVISPAELSHRRFSKACTQS